MASFIILSSPKDRAFASMALLAVVSGAILPSGFVVPQAHKGTSWVIKDEASITLISVDDLKKLRAKGGALD